MLLSYRYRVCLCLTVVAAASHTTVVADVYRWDNGAVIPGTEGIFPKPSGQLDHRNLDYADLRQFAQERTLPPFRSLRKSSHADDRQDAHVQATTRPSRRHDDFSDHDAAMAQTTRSEAEIASSRFSELEVWTLPLPIYSLLSLHLLFNRGWSGVVVGCHRPHRGCLEG